MAAPLTSHPLQIEFLPSHVGRIAEQDHQRQTAQLTGIIWV